MKMARILVFIIAIAMVFGMVGCDRISNSGGNSEVGDNDGKQNEVIDENTPIDIEYVPDAKNLIGIALCPYPYVNKVGDIIPRVEFGRWHEVYVFYEVNDAGERGVVLCGNQDMWTDSEEVGCLTAQYEFDRETLYIGYVYVEDDNETVYIVATQDLVNFDEDGKCVITIDLPYPYDDEGNLCTLALTITNKQ